MQQYPGICIVIEVSLYLEPHSGFMFELKIVYLHLI